MSVSEYTSLKVWSQCKPMFSCKPWLSHTRLRKQHQMTWWWVEKPLPPSSFANSLAQVTLCWSELQYWALCHMWHACVIMHEPLDSCYRQHFQHSSVKVERIVTATFFHCCMLMLSHCLHGTCCMLTFEGHVSVFFLFFFFHLRQDSVLQ